VCWPKRTSVRVFRLKVDGEVHPEQSVGNLKWLDKVRDSGEKPLRHGWNFRALVSGNKCLKCFYGEFAITHTSAEDHPG
jgi:hypothetical protein